MVPVAQLVILMSFENDCRFKQLRAVVMTDSDSATAAAKEAGCYAIEKIGAEGAWPSPRKIAERLLGHLGITKVQFGMPAVVKIVSRHHPQRTCVCS
jgi:hypothetical protein